MRVFAQAQRDMVDLGGGWDTAEKLRNKVRLGGGEGFQATGASWKHVQSWGKQGMPRLLEGGRCL